MSEVIEEEDKKKGPSARKRLYDRLKNKVILWKTPAGDPYLDAPFNGKIHTWHFDQPHVDAWVRKEYMDMMGGKDIPLDSIIDPVEKMLRSEALISAAMYRPYLRVAKVDQKISVDLHDNAGSYVEISPCEWVVKGRNGIKFISGDGMLPQVTPVKPENTIDSLNLLRKYLNYDNENDFRLMLCWLIGSYVADDGYPILCLNGGAGTAKSSTTSILRRLIDPHSAERREPPKDEKDIGAIAKNSHVIAFDNLQAIPTWLSDALCRVSTGGTLGGRAYYTLHRDAGFEAIRPVILNGIPQFVQMNDLMERTILITLPRIDETERTPWQEVEKEFEKDKPLILGALFDVLCKGLALYDRQDIKNLPRLAGFAKFMTACEAACGWEKGDFMRLWEENQSLKSSELIGSNSLATALLSLLDELRKKGAVVALRGTMKDLLALLSVKMPPAQLPKNPASLSHQLRRLEPDLRRQGYEVIRGARDEHGVNYEIRELLSE